MKLSDILILLTVGIMIGFTCQALNIPQPIPIILGGLFGWYYFDIKNSLFD